MLNLAVLVCFPALMAFAALSDLFTMTISNRISIALVVLFLPLAVLVGLSVHTILLHYACGAGVLVLTFTMFAFGWIGGGDAKLAAASAVWIGLEHIEDYGLYSAIFGGALTLAILAIRHFPLPLSLAKLDWAQRLHERSAGVPYGIALAAGGIAIYPETWLWHAATAAA